MVFYQSRGQDKRFILRRKTIFKFIILLCVLGGWYTIRLSYTVCKNSAEKYDSEISRPEDWFDGNITRFQNKANLYNYVVLRKTTIDAYGDFSCSSSEKRRMCSFKVETLIQAVQMCNVYGDVCVGFVLTRDMNIRLKHQVKRLNFDSQAVTLVKSAFVPRFGQTQLPKLFTSTNFSRPGN